VLSRSHSTPVASCEYARRVKSATANRDAVSEVIDAAKEPIHQVVETVGKLSQAASKMPYYKFNNMWSRQMQGAVCSFTACRITSTNSFIVRGSALLGLARRLQARGRPGQVRTAAHDRGPGRDPAQYASPTLDQTSAHTSQSPSTSRTATSSTSRSKSTCSRSSHSSKSWYVTALHHQSIAKSFFRHALLAMLSRSVTTSARCSSISSSRTCMLASRFST
jgi:hypothetical protein